MYRGWYCWWLTHWEGRGTNQVAESLKKAIGLLSMVQEGEGKMSASDHYEVAIKIKKKEVKFSRYRPGVAERVGRGIALPFHDCGTRRGWAVSSTP